MAGLTRWPLGEGPGACGANPTIEAVGERILIVINKAPASGARGRPSEALASDRFPIRAFER